MGSVHRVCEISVALLIIRAGGETRCCRKLPSPRQRYGCCGSVEIEEKVVWNQLRISYQIEILIILIGVGRVVVVKAVG